MKICCYFNVYKTGITHSSETSYYLLNSASKCNKSWKPNEAKLYFMIGNIDLLIFQYFLKIYQTIK